MNRIKSLVIMYLFPLIETGKTKTVYLNKPIPVLLLYATAFHTLDDDYVHFRNDVYDRDHAILKELQEPFKRKERHLGENYSLSHKEVHPI